MDRTLAFTLVLVALFVAAYAAAVALAGGPERAGIWAYRLPSLIGAVLAVLLTF